jgi:hypothetical protein
MILLKSLLSRSEIDCDVREEMARETQSRIWHIPFRSTAGGTVMVEEGSKLMLEIQANEKFPGLSISIMTARFLLSTAFSLVSIGVTLGIQETTGWRDPSPQSVQFVTVATDVRLEVLDLRRYGGH